MEPITSKVLSLDIANLSEEDLKWIHDLKNRAQALTGRLQLKAIQLEKEVA